MKALFRIILGACVALSLAGCYSALIVAEPWPHELRNNLLGLAFFGAVWGGVEIAAKRRGQW